MNATHLKPAEAVKALPGPESVSPVSIGLDDGYAWTKVALADGRLFAIPSRGRVGRAEVTWLDPGEKRIAEYETDEIVYSVGAVDGDATHFDGYPYSALNRVIVQHGLQHAGLAGQSVHAVSGLPVSSFYYRNGSRRTDTLDRKAASLKQPVQPVDGGLAASVAFHEVIPEALAAWYDHVIVESDGQARLDPERLAAPVAVVDIGGRTTDYVVVADQAVIHASSGSLQCGMLDVKREVTEGIRTRFDLERVSERTVEQALKSTRVRLYGKEHDISELIQAAGRQVLERIHAETRRQLGGGAELDRILFVGGGTLALAEDIRDWFPNQAIAEHPAFANARGMLKYLRYVCEETPS